ncbi:unnamed protein product [Trichobilharzia regenti]|nr:unnamed protein product [Trichobilharzia regenti]
MEPPIRLLYTKPDRISLSSSEQRTMDGAMTAVSVTPAKKYGVGNPCTTAHFCHASHYINNNNNSNNNANHHNSPIGVPVGTTSRLLSLDRPPLKGLLAAALNAFIKATHTRLSNISPRQYSEFVDFLTRARDTFHLLRPDGPLQFRQWVEFLRQTYRGKRKLVSLLSERFD